MKPPGVGVGCAAIVLFFVMAALIGRGGSGGEKSAPVKPLQSADAAELARAFLENEAAAKDRFVDAPLNLSGKVAQVSDGSDGATIVHFKGGVVAKVDAADRPAMLALRSGSNVSLNCRTLLYVLTYITPQDCRVAP